MVTYQGHVSWSKRAFFDDDYNFNLQSDDHAAYTVQNSSAIHTEFDSDETIDNFHIEVHEAGEEGIEPEERFEMMLAGLPPETKGRIDALKKESHPVFHWSPLQATNLSAAPSGFVASLARKTTTAKRAAYGRIRVAPNPRKKRLYENMGQVLREAKAAPPR